MPSAASRLMPTLRRVVLAGAGADRTDGQLLGAFIVDRDADAFAGLVRRHGPMVLGVCRRVVGDQSVADDAFQAVFIVLARRAGAVKPREQVGNWLYGVAYRTALKARAVLARRRSREKQVDVMPEPPVSTRTTAEWADLQPLIDEELARLPDKLRVPVVLCDLEGRTQRDVARHLGIPPATLATRIASARRALAARLSKRGVTLSGGALAGLLSANGTASAVPYALGQIVTRAAEALAVGGAPLVSAHAVQLSEGVMRMMLLTKLKAVAVTVLTVAALSGGLGLGLVPAYALSTAGEPAPAGSAQPAEPAPVVAVDEFIETKLKEVSIELNADIDDATFLRRLSLDLRGILPTDVEHFFFIRDEDEDKRAKVVVWMSDDDEVKAHAAKKLGVPAERVVRARLLTGGDGQERRLVVVVDGDGKAKPQALAFSPDGKRLAIEVVNDVKNPTVFLAPSDVKLDVAVDKEAKWIDLHGEVIRLEGNVTNATRDEVLWAQIGDDRKTVTGKTVTTWESADGARPRFFAFRQTDDKANETLWAEAQALAIRLESDAEFLKRVIQDVRGTAPTALEEKYFAEDKDPKKREKLLDQLLKDPAVAKKVGEDWKKRMLATEHSKEGTYRYRFVPKTIDPAQGKRNWVPQFYDLPDFKPDGGTFKLQVAPAVDPKSGKVELKWQTDPMGNAPFKLVVPDRKPAEVKEGVYEWRVVPTIPGKPSPPNPPEPTKTRTVKVPATPATPATPVAPVTPKTPQTRVVPATPKPPVAPAAPARPAAGQIDRLVDLLIAAKKSDVDILDFITIDILGRLPTDAEKKLTLGLVSRAADRKAAWLEVARALAGTKEGKERSDAAGHGNVIELKGVLELNEAVDLDVIELKGTIEGARDVFEHRVNPDVKTVPELKPRKSPPVKPAPPAKK